MRQLWRSSHSTEPKYISLQVSSRPLLDFCLVSYKETMPWQKFIRRQKTAKHQTPSYISGVTFINDSLSLLSSFRVIYCSSVRVDVTYTKLKKTIVATWWGCGVSVSEVNWSLLFTVWLNRRVQTLYTMILYAFNFHQNKRKLVWWKECIHSFWHFLSKDPISIHFNPTRMFDITGVTFIKVVSR